MGKLTALKYAHCPSRGGMPTAMAFFLMSPARRLADGFFGFSQMDGEGKSVWVR